MWDGAPDDFCIIYWQYISNSREIEFLADTIDLPDDFNYGCSVTEYVIPRCFKTLPDTFGAGLINVTDLTIPSTVVQIGESVFAALGTALSDNVTIHVVQGSVADTWAKTQQASNDRIVIDYITE